MFRIDVRVKLDTQHDPMIHILEPTMLFQTVPMVLDQIEIPARQRLPLYQTQNRIPDHSNPNARSDHQNQEFGSGMSGINAQRS